MFGVLSFFLHDLSKDVGDEMSCVPCECMSCLACYLFCITKVRSGRWSCPMLCWLPMTMTVDCVTAEFSCS